MANTTESNSPAVPEPFPIFKLAHRFLLYDPDTISYIREKYNICGVLIGGLPQAPQQNVFLGIPLELMPEEARVLVEKGVAFIQDDVKAHKNGFLGSSSTSCNGDGSGLGAEERRAYQAALRKQGEAAAAQASKKSEDRRKAALSKLNTPSGDWNDIPDDMLRPAPDTRSRSTSRGPKRKVRAEPRANPRASDTEAQASADDHSLFAQSANPVPDMPDISRQPTSMSSSTNPEIYAVTPTTSYPPLASSSALGPPPPSRMRPSSADTSAEEDLPAASSSYPLFKHMHSKGYFLAPGLRFGCQYMAYPGDPLRFHSHFLCSGMGWDEEFDLLSVVGGGRLGTGVKKGFLVGGEVPDINESTIHDEPREVRAFGIEWGGM